ncbi:terminase small subunit [Limosilactobacillus mucosae]|uniref:terminase small subunit n=1 Tax=Limosilactobacillus mucosae TaxID=97478 RepID=UPI0025A47EE7|nr:terminase small subunit [Limosilactobacillus mucosae]MDM8220031.1 terminase small subunit [Limosilactobacillus mucosae]MDM8314687.1 terminase small subunit [Limosilactobacillus mucosae]
MSSISNKKLTNKQQAFIDAYCSVSKFNATDAARRAGYKHPHVQGAQNLSKLSSQIAQRMQELKEKSGASIISQQEVAQRLSRFADGSIKVQQLANNGKLVDAPVSPKDQLKALELLGKSYGMFVDKKEINGNLDIEIGMGDYDDDED